ncbi:cysteine desulfurase SufS [Clostridiales bacterium]|nr:cysteine desulfurase SufS [Clostridiales bacterium]
MKIYFDNAATTFPKPEKVADAVYEYIKNNGMNVGRGDYSLAAEKAVYETRELICGLFGFDKPSNVIFTTNVTIALNVVLKGLLKAGDHVLTSAMEHNAVMRPLTQLLDIDVRFDRIPCDEKGRLIWADSLLRCNTRAVVMTHASNVCGTIMPIAEVGKICAEKGIIFIVDCAQSAGTIQIDMDQMNIDILCFTGHKGLYGPQGIGGFIVRDKVAAQIEPLISGGTGSVSQLETVPPMLPDRYEAGTLNIPGIYGLYEGIKFVSETGIENIYRHEMELTKKFLEGIREIEGAKMVGIDGTNGRTSVVSLQTKDDAAEIAFELNSRYGIMTRTGLQCAPNAHKTLKTYPQGTIRFSFGYFNKEEEVDYALKALKNILTDK